MLQNDVSNVSQRSMYNVLNVVMSCEMITSVKVLKQQEYGIITLFKKQSSRIKQILSNIDKIVEERKDSYAKAVGKTYIKF